MRVKFFYLLVFTLFLGACSREDESFELETTIDNPPPEEIEVDDINGIVRDFEGELLSAATVQLYEGNNIVDEVESSSTGEFIFRDVLPNKSYRVFAEKEDFHQSLVLVFEDHFDNELIEVTLLDTDLFPLPFNNFNPSDSNVVVVSGLITDEDGEGVPGILKAARTFNFECLNITFTPNGNFTILLPRDVELAIYAQSIECDVQTETLFEGFLQNDVDLGTIEIDIENEEKVISGEVIGCDDQLVLEGTIILDYQFGSSQEVPFVDGTYEIFFSSCSSDFVFLTVLDEDQNILTSISINLDGQQEIEMDLMTCPFDNFEQGEISVLINDEDSLIFAGIAIFDQFSEDIRVFSSVIMNDSFLIFSFNTDNGLPYESYDFWITLSDQEYYHTEESIEFFIEIEEPIDQLNPGSITGQFSGTLIDWYSAETIEISGSLDIPLY